MIIKCAAVLHTRKSKRLKGLPLELFVGQMWSDNFAEMIKDGTALQAVFNNFSVQLITHASLLEETNTICSPFMGHRVFYHNWL